MSQPPGVGTIDLIDLKVPNAEEVREFYRAVVGWSVSDVKMGEYHDYCMHPAPDAPPVAGVCHARGENADLPPQWLMYITVADLEASVAKCHERGAKVLAGPRSVGRFGRI